MPVRRPRAATFAAALVLACLGAPAVAHADAESDLRAAQQRANKAAAEMSAANSAAAKAENEVSYSKQRVAKLEAKMSSTKHQVRELAVRMYVEGASPINRLLRMGDANQLVQVQSFTHAIASTSGDSLRQYRADREDLGIELKALQEDEKAAASAVQTMERRKNEAVQEVDRLARVVAEAQAKREAELRAQAAAAAAAAAPSSRSGSGAAPATTAPLSRLLPAVPAAPNTPATGVIATGEWICPVQGPRAFSNDYGAARWGGGSHMGNDILSPRGTPVVASVSGIVRHKTGSISGLSYYLSGDDGNEYFGAHLDSYGASGRVEAGTVVGYVGNTGDASATAPHLHFEIHPGGSGNINPYSTLSRYC